MKHSILLLLTAFLFKVSMGQSHRRLNPYYASIMHLKDREWHLATDTLKEPASSYHINVAYQNRYDTILCHYTIAGDVRVYQGYKRFYVSRAYFTDDATTIGMFYDRHMNRVCNVDKYYFK